MIGLLLKVVACQALSQISIDKNRIQVYKENPQYWQHKSEPVLLLGGSVEDNLFQIPDIKEHLDLLRSVGGNYVRCTMSCRDEGNVWQFNEVEGLYNLDQWNEEFWQRFNNFLRLTAERDIIVQIEVWATFDYYRLNWDINPFNPKNNVNYTFEQTNLPEVVDSHPTQTENNFFWSVPAENNQRIVLEYQEKFVDQILFYSLKFDHVLYCIDNETSVTPEWGKFWAEYIQAKANDAEVNVETTEMWDSHNLFHTQHQNTLDHPELYSFCDASQNNHQRGQKHWDNAQEFRAQLNPVRPINSVKIYGSDQYHFGDDQDGLERFWRNVFGGMASARFHRPPSGLGLGPLACRHLKSMRMLTDNIRIFSCQPSNHLLSNRRENQAYALANIGKEVVVYFPEGGTIDIDLSLFDADLTLQWLDINQSEWLNQMSVHGGKVVALTTPSQGHWAVLIR
ncbi:MAG: hypothetical protein VX901_03040 [Candidatus Poribacteria bacterium]|nr:hypothetical protein [Candidatus Poribacteria bacterium]